MLAARKTKTLRGSEHKVQVTVTSLNRGLDHNHEDQSEWARCSRINEVSETRHYGGDNSKNRQRCNHRDKKIDENISTDLTILLGHGNTLFHPVIHHLDHPETRQGFTGGQYQIGSEVQTDASLISCLNDHKFAVAMGRIH